jgi:hypothetical protein
MGQLAKSVQKPQDFSVVRVGARRALGAGMTPPLRVVALLVLLTSFPTLAAELGIKLARRSTPGFVTGVSLVGAGAVLGFSGLLMQTQNVTVCNYNFCAGYNAKETLKRHQLGLAFLIAGLVFAGVGVPLVVFFGAKVQVATLSVGPARAALTVHW